MVKDQRASYDPLVGLETVSETTDTRRVRRALDLPDLLHLLRVTREGPERYGLTGPERCLIYRMPHRQASEPANSPR